MYLIAEVHVSCSLSFVTPFLAPGVIPRTVLWVNLGARSVCGSDRVQDPVVVLLQKQCTWCVDEGRCCPNREGFDVVEVQQATNALAALRAAAEAAVWGNVLATPMAL